ncbi:MULTISPECIES: TetR/AcrR family transcriptional regulator [unclassified Streptomyces]|uniref:TetR/AcrR family transcriptional regulator n=1 Tax=unclassified Streptomyces TaxID=2593676 RepID=UPI0022586C19|nr:MULTISPECIES: TetR/AcrR family transcriptional regulator [unclassified Streptomyces]MCX4525991.1 WHG domain-containing protein [Streptomyces sp. NBC_01551]MCX4543446.1 WHG domain-containing protein [Streptomyces sp. NBC_01565]
MAPRAGLTAERVTRAAADLADEVGFDSITVSALARSFGVKDASLYSHVKNVQDLRTRVAVLATVEMTDRIGPAVAGRSGKDALSGFAHAYREFALEHPGRYAATQMRLDPEVVAASPALLRCVELTYGMLRGYGLDEPDLTDAVRLLRSTFHGYSSLEAAGGFGHARDTSASWARVIDALHVTLERWPTAR